MVGLRQAESEGKGGEMAGGPVRISAVLPVYAEEGSIAELVSGLCTLIGDDLKEIILIVAKSSPEATFSLCKKVAARFPVVRISLQEQNPGLGFAVRQGIAEAQGTHILMMDSDGEMDVETVPRLVAVVKERDVDLVVASRWMKGGGVKGYSRLKYVLNQGYQLIFRLLYRTPIHDLTLGFKLGRAAVLKSIPWSAQFHDIGCETTLRVTRAGYTVAEVPTVWRRRKAGFSKNPFRRNFLYVSMALSILCGKTQNKQGSKKTQ